MCKKEYWIWLQMAIGAGNPFVSKLLDQGLNAQDVCMASVQEQCQFGLNENEVRKLHRISPDQVRGIVAKCERHNITIITPDMAEYPEKLLNMYAPPAVLYVQGNAANLKLPVSVAMVGTRTCTKYGYKAAYEIAHDLAVCGVAVVSGLARGIDSAAHRGALYADGITIGVAACGLDIDYPYGNHTMKMEILKKGTLISEYSPGTSPLGGNFPIRNRLMAGLSQGVLVAEGGIHSGALITARHALEQGKDVFAIPNNIFESAAAGANALLQAGAKPVMHALDIIEEYLPIYPDAIQMRVHKRVHTPLPDEKLPDLVSHKEKPVVRKAHVPQRMTLQSEQTKPTLEGHGAKIYEYLLQGEKSSEEMISELSLSPHEVLAALTELEISGIVAASAGKKFHIL